jgi:superfamily II DNA/RNA helicase
MAEVMDNNTESLLTSVITSSQSSLNSETTIESLVNTKETPNCVIIHDLGHLEFFVYRYRFNSGKSITLFPSKNTVNLVSVQSTNDISPSYKQTNKNSAKIHILHQDLNPRHRDDTLSDFNNYIKFYIIMSASHELIIWLI